MKKQPPKVRRRNAAARVIPPSAPLDEAETPIVERPDGFYWVAPDGKQEVGPFASLADARADRERFDDQATEPLETLQEAEREIGMADWIDPETGEPAEGQSPPHLQED